MNKKLFVLFLLFDGFSLISMDLPQIPAKPTISSALVKKYIENKPLSKQEHEIIHKAPQRAIYTIASTLGIIPSPTQEQRKRIAQSFSKYNIPYRNERDLSQIVLYKDLDRTLKNRSDLRRVYNRMWHQYPSFGKALSEARSHIHNTRLTITDLPTPERGESQKR